MSLFKVESDSILETTSALASATRLNILKLLYRQPMSVTEIAEALNMPVSSAISAVLKLEKANLLTTITQGPKKVCSVEYSAIKLMLTDSEEPVSDQVQSRIFNVPIGSFCGYSAVPGCGILGRRTFVGDGLDSLSAFRSPEKSTARLIWFRNGYLEYQITNPSSVQHKLSSLSISAEICSEFPGYNNAFPSDIYLRVNSKEVGVWHSPGDFGGRQGVFTPYWWDLNFTQYGNLVTWVITNRGSYMNGERCSDFTLSDVLDETAPILFRIGTEANGGMNIFGTGMGDYNQDIVIEMSFEEE